MCCGDFGFNGQAIQHGRGFVTSGSKNKTARFGEEAGSVHGQKNIQFPSCGIPSVGGEAAPLVLDKGCRRG